MKKLSSEKEQISEGCIVCIMYANCTQPGDQDTMSEWWVRFFLGIRKKNCKQKHIKFDIFLNQLFSKGNPGRQDSCDENNNCHDTCHSGLGTYSCGSTQHHADDKDCSCNHSITKPTDYCPSCNHCHWWDPCWSGLTGRKDYSPSDDYFATNSASKCGH